MEFQPMALAPKEHSLNKVPEYEQITTDEQLARFCGSLRGSDLLAFDTEFVSENCYRPQLCLVQVATREKLALIDAISIKDLTPFWELIVNDVGVTIVHAAREEFLFCFRATGARPKELFDLQLVGGFIGMEYPAAYTTLVNQLTGNSLSKGETRTDWRKRPLTREQTRYALQDVEYLIPMYERMNERLNRLGRSEWYREEVVSWLEELETSETTSQWQRLPSISRLNRQTLAIVRQLYDWRESEARQQDRSPRRILPDDLLVEIAKRGESNPTRVKEIRGLQQRVSDRYLPVIARQVAIAQGLPEKQWPAKPEAQHSVSLGLLGQFLLTSLNLVCVDQQIAPALVASANDIRNIAAKKLGLLRGGSTEATLQGWRQEVVGRLVDDVVSGKVALRVADPHSEQPLRLESWDNGSKTV
jgi:ribonuclease D